MGGTLMGLITGKEESGRDFQKRYTKDVLGKDYSKLESGTEHRIVSGGAQELVNEISKLKGNEKGINDFIERLKSEAPLQTPEETVKKLQDAFTSANDSQEELKKVIYDIMAEWGSMINQANPAQTIKESGEVTKELQESLQKMTDTVTQTVDLIGKATINLQKKQDAVVSKNWITGLFGIQDQ
jgi:predicted  nucleic acid-binding Zn-ribbon protein